MRIACHIPSVHDATNWYRGTSPMSHMRKYFGDISFDLIGTWQYSSAQAYDAAFFQRPSTSSELEAIQICKRLGIPVIVDFDDLFFDIPTDNPAYQSYMNKQTQETIISIMREADLVWVSTKELKRCIQIPKASLNKKVFVVPNALDEIHLVRDMRIGPPPPRRREMSVMWRGSQTHTRDVADYAAEISLAAQSSPRTPFIFVGWNPWFLTERMAPRQAIVAGQLPVGEFMEFIYSTAPQVGHVPLNDSRFNRCKSNIAWLEMSWAGAAVLAPDWEEWQHPGVTVYQNETDYLAGLKALMEMKPEQRFELNHMSWKHIEKNFFLKHTNEIRHATLEALVKGYEWPEGGEPIHDDDVVELE